MGQELALSPVFPIDEETACDHDEHPHRQVQHVEDVVEAHGVLHPQRDDDGDNDRYHQGQKIGVWFFTFP